VNGFKTADLAIYKEKEMYFQKLNKKKTGEKG